MTRRERLTGEGSDGGVPIEATFEPFLNAKGKGPNGSSGNYRSDAERELTRFLAWAREQYPNALNNGQQNGDVGHEHHNRPPVERRELTVADLDDHLFRSYAQHLREQGLAASTVRTYYGYVSAWCRWLTTKGDIPRHYANTIPARDPLPDVNRDRSDGQRAWTSDERDRLLRHVETRASAAMSVIEGNHGNRAAETKSRPELDGGSATFELDGTTPDHDPEPALSSIKSRARKRYRAIKACRDQALVYLLCNVEVQPGEVLRNPADDRRTGVRWSDIALEDRKVRLLLRNQRRGELTVAEPVVESLRRYKRIYDPPSSEWPVFPTLHYPTLARLARRGLAGQGLDENEYEAIRETCGLDLFVCLRYDLGPPPSLTPKGARRLLRRLCDDLGIEINDKRAHLFPSP